MEIVTYFNETLWSEHGQKWLASSVKVLDPIILYSEDLKEDSKKQLSCFPSAYSCEISFFSSLDFFLQNVLVEGKNYAFVSPNNVPPFGCNTEKDAYCKIKKIQKNFDFELTSSIFNLKNRISVIKSLDSILASNDGVLDSSFIWGTSDFWIAFTGFQRYLKASGFIRNQQPFYDDLILNLFYMSSSSFSFYLED